MSVETRTGSFSILFIVSVPFHLKQSMSMSSRLSLRHTVTVLHVDVDSVE